MFFRVGGLLLSTVGVFLMAMALFSSLLFVSGYNLLSNLGTLLDVALIAGITFAVVGMTLTAHSMQSNAKFLRRPCLIAGLTLVTLSVFYSILIVLEATWMAPYQFGALIQPY
jgi:predicted neutral ceramidase superfamily lipid hydrolase